MRLYQEWKEILKIQKLRRIAGYTTFFCFSALISYAYNSNTFDSSTLYPLHFSVYQIVRLWEYDLLFQDQSWIFSRRSVLCRLPHRHRASRRQRKGIYFISRIIYILCILIFELLFFVFVWDQLYKAALGNCFDIEEWGPIEFSIMAKHFERQGKSPYAYHSVSSFFTLKSLSIIHVCSSHQY